jgi:hypothetical protein
MARAGLLDVPCDESRQAGAGRALRLDLEPQLRRPSGLQGPHASRLAGDGRSRGELAPEAFVRGLSAITLRSESQTQALQTDAFLHCSKGDRRLFSPNLVASEKEKIANNPAYISRLIEYGCAYYLEGLNKVISRTLQENFLSAHEDRRDSLKKDERGWCEIFVPDKTSLGHKCETFNL